MSPFPEATLRNQIVMPKIACNCIMTKLLIIACLFLFIGCLENKPGKAFLPPNKKDINDIIQAVVMQDSLLFPDTDNLKQIPLSVNLRKLRVIVPDTTNNFPPPIDHSKISIFTLFNSLVNHQRFFERSDSSYFLSQNNSIDTCTIDKSITEKLAVTTLDEQQQKIDSGKLVHYYDLTIPILSADQMKAYIELTNNCSGCGGATGIYLKKANNKWIVAGWLRLWMN